MKCIIPNRRIQETQRFIKAVNIPSSAHSIPSPGHPRSFFFFTIVCFERVSSKLHKNTVPVFEFIILQKHLHKAQVFVVLFFPVLFSEIHSQLCHICPPSPACLSHQCESYVFAAHPKGQAGIFTRTVNVDIPLSSSRQDS